MNTEIEDDQCYMCYEGANEINKFAERVCACKGSIQIHKNCLNQLRERGIRTCSICKAYYNIPRIYHNGLELIYIFSERIRMYTINSNGEKHGLYEEWWENGQLAMRVNYVNGEYNGLYQEWWENGQLKSNCIYCNGQKEGVWQSWNRSGNRICDLTYIDGIYHNNRLKGENV